MDGLANLLGEELLALEGKLLAGIVQSLSLLHDQSLECLKLLQLELNLLALQLNQQSCHAAQLDVLFFSERLGLGCCCCQTRLCCGGEAALVELGY